MPQPTMRSGLSAAITVATAWSCILPYSKAASSMAADVGLGHRQRHDAGAEQEMPAGLADLADALHLGARLLAASSGSS